MYFEERVRQAATYLLCGFMFQSASFCMAAFGNIPTKTRIAFGSCAVQDKPMPVWSAVVDRDPDAFLFLGDNVYADTGAYKLMPSPRNYEVAYERLKKNPDFNKFLVASRAREIDVFATWDDHDYGLNDGGEEHTERLEAKEAFIDFFSPVGLAEPSLDEPGIHNASIIDLADLKVQVVMLDTRSFRSPFIKSKNSDSCERGGWVFSSDPAATILGEDQWGWLAEQLLQPADLRLIVSSIQVLPIEQCFEKWANFPAERERLLSLIAQSQAEGVVLLSGDRHSSEISVINRQDIGYPLYEITSSGLNNALRGRFNVADEPNKFRAFDANVSYNSFGEIEITGADTEHFLIFRLIDEEGVELQALEVALQSLRAN
ncbi:Phosphodiesterase/alkaline phosphatase D-like protein [Aequoribacter fuscus]|uniref:Phosphodiesterase/alkaline phosphatase D-like protein n=1 Tax=Aequoribacter fuscus TaxID=2518989 RepID=F3L3Y8_9GAMM|nr:Phosphodiesterase/alkaline phosphatase D-like protein [Aequoribacter fuscus]QHJ88585.1 alkaline phosphatase family protein [Aequoribacter fuscus]